MTEEEKKLLKDIEQVIMNIDIHLEGRRIWEEFANSITRRRAIERNSKLLERQLISY